MPCSSTLHSKYTDQLQQKQKSKNQRQTRPLWSPWGEQWFHSTQCALSAAIASQVLFCFLLTAPLLPQIRKLGLREAAWQGKCARALAVVGVPSPPFTFPMTLDGLLNPTSFSLNSCKEDVKVAASPRSGEGNAWPLEALVLTCVCVCVCVGGGWHRRQQHGWDHTTDQLGIPDSTCQPSRNPIQTLQPSVLMDRDPRLPECRLQLIYPGEPRGHIAPLSCTGPLVSCWGISSCGIISALHTL